MVLSLGMRRPHCSESGADCFLRSLIPTSDLGSLSSKLALSLKAGPIIWKRGFSSQSHLITFSRSSQFWILGTDSDYVLSSVLQVCWFQLIFCIEPETVFRSLLPRWSFWPGQRCSAWSRHFLLLLSPPVRVFTMGNEMDYYMTYYQKAPTNVKLMHLPMSPCTSKN